MKSFKQFLNEDKNLHLHHLEDQVFMGGVEGTRSAINFIRELRDMLSGNSPTSLDLTVKWDGAPAIFCGPNPETGEFFVGTKSVFNKRTPKINYTDQDIDTNHPNAGLNEKLKMALKYLKPLGFREVLQGDFLYSKSDLKTTNFQGEKLLTFTPNTITYGVPYKSNLARAILKSKIGIVFHTTYKGNTIEQMSANFGANVKTLKKSSNVWITDASFQDHSGQVTMTKKETAEIDKVLSEVGKLFRYIDPDVLNLFKNDDEVGALVAIFNNANVKKGHSVNSREYVRKFIQFLKLRFDEQIKNLKTDKAKRLRNKRLERIETLLINNESQLATVADIFNKIREAKLLIIRQLEKVKNIGTFLQTDDGFQVTAPEGFVAVDRVGQNAIKLVDRMTFSRNNFNIQKNWIGK